MAATIKADTIQNAASATANITLDTAANATVGGTLAMTGGGSFLRNRIINGDMRIDQRNAGASVTPTSGDYTLDRWNVENSQASKYSVQQNAGSVTPPTGYVNYLGVTSLSSYSLSATDYFSIKQQIEGFNVADLSWGTSGAKSIVLSFMVYSSLTGTFGGCIVNSAGSRFYAFSYSVASANTWTSISVSIPGDTSGTWLKDNGIGISLRFSLGTGSTYSASSSVWGSAVYLSVTGATSVVGTNGATFYITGVQLEVGSVATPFERRQYGQELMLCQRYYYRETTTGTFGDASAHSSTSAINRVWFPVTMRTSPTALEQTGTASNYAVYFATTGTACSAVPAFRDATTYIAQTTLTVSSGLTAGQAGFLYANAVTAYLGWSAEL